VDEPQPNEGELLLSWPHEPLMELPPVRGAKRLPALLQVHWFHAMPP
jgi:hypothetical protein